MSQAMHPTETVFVPVIHGFISTMRLTLVEARQALVLARRDKWVADSDSEVVAVECPTCFHRLTAYGLTTMCTLHNVDPWAHVTR